MFVCTNDHNFVLYQLYTKHHFKVSINKHSTAALYSTSHELCGYFRRLSRVAVR